MLRTFKIWRGDSKGGDFVDYKIKPDVGMIILDVIHRIQAEQANDLAVRWNCKAGKCGSCSVEINGKPKLACVSKLSDFLPLLVFLNKASITNKKEAWRESDDNPENQ